MNITPSAVKSTTLRVSRLQLLLYYCDLPAIKFNSNLSVAQLSAWIRVPNIRVGISKLYEPYLPRVISVSEASLVLLMQFLLFALPEHAHDPEYWRKKVLINKRSPGIEAPSLRETGKRK